MTKKYDLHTHLFTTWERGKYSAERRPRTAEYILDSIRKSELDGIVLANFSDNRFEKFDLSLGKNHRTIKYGGYLLEKRLPNAVVFSDDKGEIAVIRGQEIPTSKGHILVIGANYGENIEDSLPTEEAVRKARDKGTIVVAVNHPRQKLHENPELFDAYESFNGNYGLIPDNETRRKFEESGLRGIAVSDSHNRKDLGNGYITLNSSNLDFKSEDNLRDSLREILHKREFKITGKRKNSLISKAGHCFILAYDIFVRDKFGLIPRD